MDADEYQRFTKKTAIYPPETALSYLALGLASEAGEVCDKLKKHIRDSTEKQLSDEQVLGLAKELGDSCTAYIKPDKYALIYNAKGSSGWMKVIVNLNKAFLIQNIKIMIPLLRKTYL